MLVKTRVNEVLRATGETRVKDVIFDFGKTCEYRYVSGKSPRLIIERGESSFFFDDEAAVTLWAAIEKQHQEQEAGGNLWENDLEEAREEIKFLQKALDKNVTDHEIEDAKKNGYISHLEGELARAKGLADVAWGIERKHKEACDLLRDWMKFSNSIDLDVVLRETAEFLGLD